jgi:hypothetical protein
MIIVIPVLMMILDLNYSATIACKDIQQTVLLVHAEMQLIILAKQALKHVTMMNV